MSFASRAMVPLAALTVLSALPLAAQKVRTERVRFKPGTSSIRLEGRITGYETVDYVVGAGKGQSMNVSLGTKHPDTYFNIMAPGKTEEAFFIGSTAGNQYEGTLTASGDYTIRVYMMRNAARRKELANYGLEIIITGSPQAHGGHDAKVPGTEFHATGSVPCSMGGGQPATTCSMGVTRQGGGTATVKVTKPDGRTRTIFFEKGAATGYDQSQADPGEFKATRESDLTTVHIGKERYEIPDAAVFGG